MHVWPADSRRRRQRPDAAVRGTSCGRKRQYSSCVQWAGVCGRASTHRPHTDKRRLCSDVHGQLDVCGVRVIHTDSAGPVLPRQSVVPYACRHYSSAPFADVLFLSENVHFGYVSMCVRAPQLAQRHRHRPHGVAIS
jgi:hypothetical protein